MITHTDVQIINNRSGLPEFAVLPYSEYLTLINKKEIDTDNAVPSNVVDMVFKNDYTPTKAWRIHLGLSQEEVAEKIGITQSAYSQYEQSTRLRKATLKKIADALEINVEQLMF